MSQFVITHLTKSIIPLMLLLIVSCSNFTNSSIAPTATTAIPSSLSTTASQTSITLTETPITSVLPETNINPTITLTSLPTVTTSPTLTIPSFPLVPTFTRDEYDNYFLNLITTNGECELPCLLSINPKNTTVKSAFDLLAPLGDRRMMPEEFPYSFNYAIDDEISNIALTFNERNNIIQYLSLGSEIESSQRLRQAMERYSLYHIFQQFGPPTRIMIKLRNHLVEPNDEFNYDLWVFYDHLGFLLHYNGPHSAPTTQTGLIKVCPQYEKVRVVKIYAQSLEADQTLDELWIDVDGLPDEYLNELVGDGTLHEVENAFNMDVQEFYTLIIESDGGNCFESSADIWPGG